MIKAAERSIYIVLLLIFCATGFFGCDGENDSSTPRRPTRPTPTPIPTPTPTPTPTPSPTPVPANPAFNGTFVGVLLFNQDGEITQTLATLETSVGSPLSGILELLGLGKLIEIFGEASGDTANFEGTSDVPCPVSELTGTLELVNGGTSIILQDQGTDCLGKFTLNGELDRTTPLPTPTPGPTPEPTPTPGPTPSPSCTP